MIRIIAIIIATFFWGGLTPTYAQEPGVGAANGHTTSGKKLVEGKSGLPIPRFVTLGASQVNVRAGPGVRYPVSFTFQRKGYPVEIIAEYDLWRKIKDIEGSEGWVHKNMLSGKRSAILLDRMRIIYDEPSTDGLPVLLVESRVIAPLKACRRDWCELEIDGIEGWIPRDQIYGTYKAETFKR